MMRPRNRALQAYLKQGGVVAYPTESCYGLGCAPDSYRGIQKILRLKKRPQHKGLIVIAAHVSQLENRLIQPLATLPAPVVAQTQRYWPGSYTLLLPKQKKTLPILTGKQLAIAVRVTANRMAQQVCHQAQSALVSTSANRSGKRAIKTYRECVRQFGATGIKILRGQTGRAKKPSTIIDPFSGQKLR